MEVSYLVNRMATDDEGSLIARSRNGDWQAFAELIRLHQNMIHSLAYRMSGSSGDAQDLTQETFIHAYRALGTYRGDSKFSSWLYRIALNLCIRWRRREERRRSAHLGWAESEANQSDPGSASEQVREALQLLPPKQRAAVVLTVYDGMTHAEAASVLGCAEATLSWRLFAARRRLASILSDGGFSP